MDLDAPASPEAELCSICLDPVPAAPSPGVRSIALLQCGHKFHLDCIGSLFNAKGTMQCPNCRNIEEGNWLSANTIPPSTDSNSGFGNGVPSETHEVLIDLAQSSSIDGSTPLDSVLQSVFL
ncbi:E3 ubiquitin-protein ligase RFI2-like [Panicum virgatum]|uniref:E3 ubiquitin-protein ligase RFI2-like n=1 Tax=Panicum virgatum TaxID=38727 RepID=UPI0019D5E5CB|nr:E3 ubiquitin-protein ligase RFI2-like [Panicum virgatum]